MLPVFVFVLVVGSSTAHADKVTLVQQYDIAEMMMQKYYLETEQKQFTIFYRFSALEGPVEGGTEDLDARLTLITIDTERTSLVLHMENTQQTDLMSLRFPMDLLSAEGEKFTVLADGQERGYELSVRGESTNLIFLLPKDTAKIDVIGTRVIPEFGSELLILSVVSALLLAARFLNSKSQILS